MIDFDFLADLPAPQDDEPASLRSDIEDELADHLKCAFRREILKDGNEAAAETRVLDRFGDPRKLARRLWWQAMWSRIMGKRILAGLQWILTLSAVVLAGAVLWQQSSLIMELRTAREADSQKYEAITAMMQELKTRTTASTPPARVVADAEADLGTTNVGLHQTQPGAVQRRPTIDELTREFSQSLVVRLVREDGSTPLDPSAVGLGLSLNGEQVIGVWGSTPDGEDGDDAQRKESGGYVFRLLQPNRYELHVAMGADNLYCDIPILIRSNEHRELTITCPNPSVMATVYLTAPPLPSLLQGGCELAVTLLESTQKINDIEWRSKGARYHLAKFDGKGGAITELTDARGETINLRQAASEDRAVILLPGTVQYHYEITYPPNSGSGFTTTVMWPENAQTLTHSLTPGNNEWVLELPEELLDKASKQFIGSPFVSPAPSPHAVSATTPPPATVADDIPAILSIKLVEGSVDGPPVLGAQAYLSGENVDVVQFEESEVFRWNEQKRGFPLPGRMGHPIKGNVFRFTGLKPNRYSLRIWLKNDDLYGQSVLIRDEKPQELIIVCPPARSNEKSPVSMTAAPLPEDLQQAGYRIWCLFTPKPFKSGSIEWDLNNIKFVLADFKGNGELESIDGEPFSPKTTLEDRVAFLPQQTFLISIKVTRDKFDGGRSEVSDPQEWLEMLGDRALRTVAPGENRWHIEAPDELITSARERLSKLRARTTVPGVSPGGAPIGRMGRRKNVPDEQTPLGDKSRWIIELKSEVEDGPAQTDVAIFLNDEHNQPVNLGNHIGEYRPNREGRCVLGPIDPGRYSLLVRLPEDRMLEYKLPLVRPGQERIEKIVCPKRATRSTALITVSRVPKDFLRDEIELNAKLTSEEITLNGKTWSASPDGRLHIRFDTSTGLVDQINDLNLKGLPNIAEEDRAVLIPTGPYRLTLALDFITTPGPFGRDGRNVDITQLVLWPTSEKDRNGAFEFVAQSGENKWDIKVPDEFWAKARSALAEHVKN